MSSFKEVAAADLETFFDTDELAELHNIDGKEIPVVIDSDLLDKSQLAYAEGVYVNRIVLFVEKAHFERLPVQGQRMKLDGERYEVASVSGGIVLQIILEANQT